MIVTTRHPSWKTRNNPGYWEHSLGFDDKVRHVVSKGDDSNRASRVPARLAYTLIESGRAQSCSSRCYPWASKHPAFREKCDTRAVMRKIRAVQPKLRFLGRRSSLLSAYSTHLQNPG